MELDATDESWLRNPLQLLRLYKKSSQCIVRRDAQGIPHFLNSFELIDSKCVKKCANGKGEGPVSLNELYVRIRPAFPSTVLADRELKVLLACLPLPGSMGDTEAGLAQGRSGDNSSVFGALSRSRDKYASHSGVANVVEVADVFMMLREMVPYSTWQMFTIVRLARRSIFKSDCMSGFEEHVVDVLSNPRAPPVTESEAHGFLVSPACGLSSSESDLLLQYCAREDVSGNGSSSASTLSLPVLHGLLFSDPMPPHAEYPLLAGRFAEATAVAPEDGRSTSTGSMALLDALQETGIVMHSTEMDDLTMLESYTTAISVDQFSRLCSRLFTGFTEEETHSLFGFLNEDAHGAGVLVRAVALMFRRFFPPVRLSLLGLIQDACKVLLRRKGDQLIFVRLYTRLEQWGTHCVPLRSYVAALRECGVPGGAAGVADIELEWLRLRAPTRVDLLMALCLPAPSGREAVVRKLYDRLGGDSAEGVSAGLVMERFCPSRVEGVALRKNAVDWRQAFATFIDELGDDQLTYDIFAFFWHMISAAVEDDPTFTMVMWQGFSLTDGKARGGRGF